MSPKIRIDNKADKNNRSLVFERFYYIKEYLGFSLNLFHAFTTIIIGVSQWILSSDLLAIPNELSKQFLQSFISLIIVSIVVNYPNFFLQNLTDSKFSFFKIGAYFLKRRPMILQNKLLIFFTIFATQIIIWFPATFEILENFKGYYLLIILLSFYLALLFTLNIWLKFTLNNAASFLLLQTNQIIYKSDPRKLTHLHSKLIIYFYFWLYTIPRNLRSRELQKLHNDLEKTIYSDFSYSDLKHLAQNIKKTLNKEEQRVFYNDMENLQTLFVFFFPFPIRISKIDTVFENLISEEFGVKKNLFSPIAIFHYFTKLITWIIRKKILTEVVNERKYFIEQQKKSYLQRRINPYWISLHEMYNSRFNHYRSVLILLIFSRATIIGSGINLLLWGNPFDTIINTLAFLLLCFCLFYHGIITLIIRLRYADALLLAKIGSILTFLKSDKKEKKTKIVRKYLKSLKSDVHNFRKKYFLGHPIEYFNYSDLHFNAIIQSIKQFRTEAEFQTKSYFENLVNFLDKFYASIFTIHYGEMINASSLSKDIYAEMKKSRTEYRKVIKNSFLKISIRLSVIIILVIILTLLSPAQELQTVINNLASWLQVIGF